MKHLEITKDDIIECVDKEFINKGIVGFQLIHYKISYFGVVVENYLDTKIMKDGKQIVIDGDGFIESGTDINTLV